MRNPSNTEARQQLMFAATLAGLPSGNAALGYGEPDVPALAQGAFTQQRPLVMAAPRGVSLQDLEALHRDAMRNW